MWCNSLDSASVHLFFRLFFQEIISLFIGRASDVLPRKIVLKFCIDNDQLRSDDGHVTSAHASVI